MEEKEEKFFRAVLKRPDNLASLDYDYDPAINLFLSDESLESLKNKYDIEKLRKFIITREDCVIFGIVTNLSVTEKDLQKIPLTIFPFRNSNSLPNKLEFLDFKKWNYSEINYEIFPEECIRFDNNLIIHKNLKTFVFSLFFLYNKKWDCYINDNKNDKKLFYRIFNTEVNYGRKRKKSITDNRPTV